MAFAELGSATGTHVQEGELLPLAGLAAWAPAARAAHVAPESIEIHEAQRARLVQEPEQDPRGRQSIAVCPMARMYPDVEVRGERIEVPAPDARQELPRQLHGAETLDPRRLS